VAKHSSSASPSTKREKKTKQPLNRGSGGVERSWQKRPLTLPYVFSWFLSISLLSRSISLHTNARTHTNILVLLHVRPFYFWPLPSSLISCNIHLGRRTLGTTGLASEWKGRQRARERNVGEARRERRREGSELKERHWVRSGRTGDARRQRD
jgi:hypothetical protein